MIIISNTGPIIALAKIQKLNILRNSGWKDILIPPMVHRELWGKTGFESDAITNALDCFIKVVPPKKIDIHVEMATAGLDKGEKEVIHLGISTDDDVILLLDDYAGRRAARQLDLAVIGTAGLLLLAKKRGLINSVYPLLQEMRDQGYWLSDALISHVRHLAGED